MQKNKTGIILTGYGKFADFKQNFTQNIILSLSQQQKKNSNIIHSQVLQVGVKQVNFFIQNIPKIIHKHKIPILMIHLGIGPNQHINIQTCAYNCMNFGCADQNNYKPINKPIEQDCKLNQKKLSKIDVYKLKQDLCEWKLNISDDPGRYLCNYIYYKSLSELQGKDTKGCLFIHFNNESKDIQKAKQFILDLCKYLCDQN